MGPVTSASPSCRREAWGRGHRAGRARPREQSRESRAGGNRPGAGAPQAPARPPRRLALTEWPAGPRPGPVPPRAPPWPGPQPSRRRDRRRRCRSCRCCCCCCSGKPVRNRRRPPPPRADPIPSPPSEWGKPEHLPRSTPSSPSPLSRALFLAGPYRLRPFPLWSPLPPSPFFIPTPQPTRDFSVTPPPSSDSNTKRVKSECSRHPPHLARSCQPDLGFRLRLPPQACGEFLPASPSGRVAMRQDHPHFPCPRAGRLRPRENWGQGARCPGPPWGLGARTLGSLEGQG